jgi:catechol 2,3-dioxygenase-like lactoylglutathione lyase family enzyme
VTAESVFFTRAREQAGADPAAERAPGRRFPLAEPGAGFAAVDSMLARLTFHHFGIVVADLEPAREFYTVALGVDAWQVLEQSGPALWRGRLIALDGTRVAVGRLGMGHVLLVEPGCQPSLAREMFDRRGEGLFAVGYLVDDLGDMLRGIGRGGTVVEQVRPDRGDPHEAYLDGGSGVLVTLLQQGAPWPARHATA